MRTFLVALAKKRGQSKKATVDFIKLAIELA